MLIRIKWLNVERTLARASSGLLWWRRVAYVEYLQADLERGSGWYYAESTEPVRAPLIHALWDADGRAQVKAERQRIRTTFWHKPSKAIPPAKALPKRST